MKTADSLVKMARPKINPAIAKRGVFAFSIARIVISTQRLTNRAKTMSMRILTDEKSRMGQKDNTNQLRIIWLFCFESFVAITEVVHRVPKADSNGRKTWA